MNTDASTASTSPHPVILRATDGKKVKLSTIIEPTDQITFQASYMLLLRTTFATSLRKRDKKKEKDRKNASILVPKVVGPKRGAGRSKRVSTLRARLAALAKINAQRKRDRQRTVIAAKLTALGA